MTNMRRRPPAGSSQELSPRGIGAGCRTLMCTHRIINPGLPPEEFDAFDSDEERSDPMEDKHHAIFDCSAYTDA